MSDLFVCKVMLTEKTKDAGLSEKDMDVVGEHAAYLTKLGEQGTLIFAGRTKTDPVDPRTYGIIMINASSQSEVEKLRDNDPAYKASIQNWEILPFSMGIRFLENLK